MKIRTILSRVTSKNLVVFFETQCSIGGMVYRRMYSVTREYKQSPVQFTVVSTYVDRFLQYLAKHI